MRKFTTNSKRKGYTYVRLYLARAAPGPREYECRQILIMPEGIIGLFT